MFDGTLQTAVSASDLLEFRGKARHKSRRPHIIADLRNEPY